MGYSTEFSGSIGIDPPFSPEEIKYLKAFSHARHMDRDKGPFHIHDPLLGYAQPDVRDSNEPPDGQPSLNTHWIASEDGRSLLWDGGEKFYYPAEWLSGGKGITCSFCYAF